MDISKNLKFTLVKDGSDIKLQIIVSEEEGKRKQHNKSDFEGNIDSGIIMRFKIDFVQTKSPEEPNLRVGLLV